MPSLQSQLVTATLKRVVKVRWLGDLAHVPLIRAAVAAPSRFSPRELGVEVRPSRHPDGEWLEPPHTLNEGAIVLYFHGGGYFFSSPRTHRPLTAALSRYGRVRVFALRYRLAPEFPFPAALEDALDAFRYLTRTFAPPSQIVLAGDSAGGGLAISALVALKQRGEPMPAAAVCFSPWTDLAATGRTLDSNDSSCAMFFGDCIRRAARIYLGGADPRTPLASPLYADLRGLPPILVHVSDSEVLLDDSVRLATRAGQQDADLTLKVWPGQPHIWQAFAQVIPEGRQSLQEAGAFIQKHTNAWVARGNLHLPYAFP